MSHTVKDVCILNYHLILQAAPHQITTEINLKDITISLFKER